MEALVGRNEEIELLNELVGSKKAELLAIYGRRRVGKTFLISQHLKNRGLYFEMTGVKDGSIKEQLRIFVESLRDAFGSFVMEDHPKDWLAAFNLLKQLIKKEKRNQKIILFFDEFPWMETRKSGLLKAFESLWNTFLTKNPKVLCIMCGSSVSWMVKKIIRNRGGLHGRLTAQIRLKPFTLKETEEFFIANHIPLDRK